MCRCNRIWISDPRRAFGFGSIGDRRDGIQEVSEDRDPNVKEIGRDWLPLREAHSRILLGCQDLELVARVAIPNDGSLALTRHGSRAKEGISGLEGRATLRSFVQPRPERGRGEYPIAPDDGNERNRRLGRLGDWRRHDGTPANIGTQVAVR